MQNIIAPISNPFFRCVEQMVLKVRIEKIIRNTKLSDEEKVDKIVKLIKADGFVKNIIVY